MTAALRVTDGALVVVDCVEGVCVQTETVLRQALGELVRVGACAAARKTATGDFAGCVREPLRARRPPPSRCRRPPVRWPWRSAKPLCSPVLPSPPSSRPNSPVITINKLDRAFLELQLPSEDMYVAFTKHVENVNVLVATYNDEALGDVQVDPTKGTVAFSAGLHGWAFTLTKFARMYAKKFGVDVEKMMGRLWGDNYFNAKEKKWIKQRWARPAGLERAFCMFCLTPIAKIFKNCMDEKYDAVTKMLGAVGVTLTKEDLELRQKPLLKRCMQKWLPAHDALLEMFVQHLPSPRKAQKYRVSTLYTGPSDDQWARASEVRPRGPAHDVHLEADPDARQGPLLRLRPRLLGHRQDGPEGQDHGPQLRAGQEGGPVRQERAAHHPHDGPQDRGRRVRHRGQHVRARRHRPVHCQGGHHRRRRRDRVAPDRHDEVLGVARRARRRLAQEPERPAQARRGPQAPLQVGPARAVLDGGVGRAHHRRLRRAAHRDLPQGLAGGLHEQRADRHLRPRRLVPRDGHRGVVAHRHVQVAEQAQPHLRQGQAARLRQNDEQTPLAEDIENGKVTAEMDAKARTRVLVDKYGWDKATTQKIWCFGPDGTGPNIVVDVTVAVQYLNEIKDSVVAGWQWVCKEGPLCDETLRDVRIDIHDVVLHADAIHRGGGQIIPTARRVFLAAILTASPRLQEPVFLVEIQCPENAMGGVYSSLNRKRGTVVEETNRPGTPLYNVKAYLPVAESFGFTGFLRQNTGGQAFPQMVFHHWDTMMADPFKDDKVIEIITAARKRKGLKETMPPLSEYEDKL